MTDSIEQYAKEHADKWGFQPKVQHHFSDNLYAKRVEIPAGHFVIKHKHNYSHLSILATGKVRVETDGSEPVIYGAGSCIEITEGINHAVIALEDSVWFCIHQTDEKDPDLVDQVLIGKE